MASSRSAYGSMAVLAAVVFSLALLAMAASTTTYPIGGFCYESTYGEISDSNFIARRRSVNSLLAGLTAKARSNAGFATSSAGRGDAVFYGLAQCRGDCRSTATSKLGQLCGGAQGCRIDYSSCWVRYEIYPFYFPLAAGAGRAAATDMTKYTKITVH
uniref:Gnk2-homologous domain-containing protein n=1 Tax=Oryza brachyantha TaxID=4533 RepID=J3MQ67_ORYBR